MEGVSLKRREENKKGNHSELQGMEALAVGVL